MMSRNSNTKQTQLEIVDNDTLIPIIPLKDVVIFPNMVVPLFIGRQKSINALEISTQKDNVVILLSQKDPQDNDATTTNVQQVGTLAKILQILKLPDGTNKVLIEGRTRAIATKIVERDGYLASPVEEIETKQDVTRVELEAIKREIIQKFTTHTK